jgi:hypothetical protein
MTNTKKATNHWRKKLKTKDEEDLPCSWIDRINIVEMTIFPKAIYMLNRITINILMTFTIEIENHHQSSSQSTKDKGNTEQKEQH